MLATVLLHISGLIVVIIVSAVISLFSSKKKQKKNSFFSQFMSNMSNIPGMPNMSGMSDDTDGAAPACSPESAGAASAGGTYMSADYQAAQAVMPDFVVSEVTDTDSLDADSLEDDIFEESSVEDSVGVASFKAPLNTVHSFKADQANSSSAAFSTQGPKTSTPAEETKQLSSIDDTIESEYSLKDPDDARRAIIYSEILKPKF